MKRNKMMRVASTLLVAVMLTTCVISGTYAKYTSEKTASDVARVAKWQILVNDNDLYVESENVTFDLFETVKDTGLVTENEVAVVDGESIIAPGTSGSFDLVIENKSEVDAEYAITLEEDKDYEIPLQYSVDGKNWTEDISTLSVEEVALDMDKDATVTVYWRWVFDAAVDKTAPTTQNDANDTKLGVDAVTETLSVEITATINVTQVD